MKVLQVEKDLEMRLTSMRYKDELISLVLDNLDHLHEWMAWATKPYDSAKTVEFLERVEKAYEEEKELPFVIFFEGRPAGTIGLFGIDLNNRSGEIGYWLAENEQGKGIVTKCCKALIDHVFEELDLNRIVVKCATENFKSQAIPERLGFTEEGQMRQERWHHDHFISLIVYSILKEEWENI